MSEIVIENFSLAIQIAHKLCDLGIRNSIFPLNASFSSEELKSIHSITISGCDSLEGIQALSRLRELVIMDPNLDSFASNLRLKNQITDFSPINQLTELQTLGIFYNEDIKTLDITNLKQLKAVKLFCNNHLKRIIGLDSLQRLDLVAICGCPVESVGDIKSYIDNTKDTVTNLLDISMFCHGFSEAKIRNYLKERIYNNLSNIHFGEHIFFYDQAFVINLYEMSDLYNRATMILKTLNLEAMSDFNKVKQIYDYLTSHLKYDYAGLDYRNQNYVKFQTFTSEEKRYFMRRLATINSSFGALTRRKAVCDGYVNAMKFLLTLCNIPAQTVICKDHNELHSAIKFFVDGVWHYADPEKDRNGDSQQFFNLSKDEFSAYYELAPREEFDEKRVLEKRHYYGQYTI